MNRHRKGARATLTRLAVLLVLAAPGVLGAAGPARAQTITFTGTNSPNLATQPSPVTVTTGLVVGNRATGSIDIPAGGILNVTGTSSCAVGALGNIAGSCIGDAAMGRVTVDGAGATFTNAGNLGVGFNGGTGTLTIANGGTVTTAGNATIGGQATAVTGVSTGMVMVSGVDANGMPATWSIGGTLVVGGVGPGMLTISNGGQVSDTSAILGNTTGTGNATVTGAGSTWTSTGALTVGSSGTGALTISNAALVKDTTTSVASAAISTGTINFDSGGTLQTGALKAGGGSAQVNFNDGVLVATQNNSSFIAGFSGTKLNIMASGLTIDSAAFTIATDASSAFTGVGGLIKIGSGTLTLNAINTYAGTTTVAAGTLAAGGVNVLSANSHTVVASGGTLALRGFDQTLNNGLENAGTVELGVPGVTAPGTTLTVAGNYVGNGGTLSLNTFLGADNSPSDKLVINGGTADPSLLRIINMGGPGAETTANGILVVQAINGGTTTPNAFTLAGEVRGGAFDYDLFRGNAPNVNDPTATNNWFLRSTFVNGPGGPEEPIGPTPPPEPLPPGVWPIIGPELATYGVVQPIARQMGLTTLGTLHERVGDAAADATCLNADSTGNSATLDSAAITKAPPVPYGNCRPAIWGRLFGQQIDNHYQAFADPRASGQVAGIQAGADLWRGSLIPGHSDTAGVYFAYGNGNVSVDGLVTNAAATAYILEHTGSVNLNAYSVGGYWTHYGPSGWYIDAVLQGSFYNGNAATQFANLPISGTGFTSSLETGYPIPLPWFGPGFVLEPEGQIIWQQVSFRDDNDGLGPVGLGTTSGASGRLGLRGKWTISDPAGRVWQPYVLANIWRDWAANATTMFGPDPVPLSEQATRLEFAGGLSAKLLPGLSLYAQAGYQFAVSGTDGGRRDGVKGDFGVRYSW